MTSDEAISILEKERREHHSFSTDIIGQAQALGIEALKAFKQARSPNAKATPYYLPGETKD